MEEEGPQSSFMFLVTCNEAFGYSHEQILDSSFVLLVGMLRERGYLMNRRVKDFIRKIRQLKRKMENGLKWLTSIQAM